MMTKIWLALSVAMAVTEPASAAELYQLKRYLPVPPSADNALDGAFATCDIGAFVRYRPGG